jgi:branched-chain amino acid transport system substrate-binding protein
MNRQLKALTAITAAGVITLFGCSFVGAAENEEGASGSPPIVIGSIVDQTGDLSSSTAGYQGGLQVFVDWVNNHGGIAGRKVVLDSVDTQSNPTVALAGAQKLVQQGNVAVVTPGTGLISAIAPYFQSNKFPLVGGVMNSPLFGTDPYLFASGTTPPHDSEGAATAAVVEKAPKVAIFYCTEVPACAQSVPLFSQSSAAVGAKVIYTTTVSGSASSYASQCLAAKGHGVQSVILLTVSAAAVRIAQDCAAQGYNPVWLALSTSVSTQFEGVSALNGTLIQADDLPFFATSAPPVKTFLNAVKTYSPGLPSQPTWGQSSIQGWIAGQFIKDAIQSANVPANQTVTSADVLKGLYSLKHTTVGGLAPPITIQQGKPEVVPCFFLGTVKNKAFALFRNSDNHLCPPSKS